MKKYILTLGILPLLFACRGSKKAANQPIPETEVEVVIPCSGPDFFTNKKYFRAKPSTPRRTLVYSGRPSSYSG
mgnify:CR=1 FL=1